MAARKSPPRSPDKQRPAGKGPARRGGPKQAPPRVKKPKAPKVKAPAAPLPAADGHPAWPLASAAAKAALDKKAENVLILDVRGLTSYADFFVVASGSSDRQVQAIADSIEDGLKKSGERPIGVEGQQNGHWVLLDYGDVVCHVFYDEARLHYDLEGLWADAPRITVEG